MTDYTNDSASSSGEFSPHHIKLGGTSVAPLFSISTNSDGPKMSLNGGAFKSISWKDNGDGTYTLIGQ